MMIHGGGTTPPTMTSLHGRSPGTVTVIDYHYFVVLRVAIDYWFLRPLVRSPVYDINVFIQWLSVIKHVACLQCNHCGKPSPCQGIYRVVTSWWVVWFPLRVSSSCGLTLYFGGVFVFMVSVFCYNI